MGPPLQDARANGNSAPAGRGAGGKAPAGRGQRGKHAADSDEEDEELSAGDDDSEDEPLPGGWWVVGQRLRESTCTRACFCGWGEGGGSRCHHLQHSSLYGWLRQAHDKHCLSLMPAAPVATMAWHGMGQVQPRTVCVRACMLACALAWPASAGGQALRAQLAVCIGVLPMMHGGYMHACRRGGRRG